MIKVSLEKFDSPIVIINQVFEDEDWGVVASYMSKRDVEEDEGGAGLAGIGWHVRVTLPSFDDADFDQVFSTPEAALEFGISQIVSGSLSPITSTVNGMKGDSHPLGHYNSIVRSGRG